MLIIIFIILIIITHFWNIINVLTRSEGDRAKFGLKKAIKM